MTAPDYSDADRAVDNWWAANFHELCQTEAPPLLRALVRGLLDAAQAKAHPCIIDCQQKRDIARLTSELAAAGTKLDDLGKLGCGCPCLHTTPCDPQCTCVRASSSFGCLRCCSYGSPEQQRAMAECLTSELATVRAELEDLKSVRQTELDHVAMSAEEAFAEADERASDYEKWAEDTAAELGCEDEWSNLHSHFVCIRAAALTGRSYRESADRTLVDQREKLASAEAENARLRATLRKSTTHLENAIHEIACSDDEPDVDHDGEDCPTAATDSAVIEARALLDGKPRATTTKHDYPKWAAEIRVKVAAAMAEPPCTCAAIQAADPSRHFRECPMRAVYPECATCKRPHHLLLNDEKCPTCGVTPNSVKPQAPAVEALPWHIAFHYDEDYHWTRCADPSCSNGFHYPAGREGQHSLEPQAPAVEALHGMPERLTIAHRGALGLHIVPTTQRIGLCVDYVRADLHDRALADLQAAREEVARLKEEAVSAIKTDEHVCYRLLNANETIATLTTERDDAALTAAGFPDQASRDAERARRAGR